RGERHPADVVHRHDAVVLGGAAPGAGKLVPVRPGRISCERAGGLSHDFAFRCWSAWAQVEKWLACTRTTRPRSPSVLSCTIETLFASTGMCLPEGSPTHLMGAPQDEQVALTLPSAADCSARPARRAALPCRRADGRAGSKGPGSAPARRGWTAGRC